MPRSSNVPESIRLFVAAYPPTELAVDLLCRLQKLQLPPSIRAVEPNQIHLTLQFIGEVQLYELDEVREAVLCAGKGIETFELSPLQIAAWPRNMGIKRVFVAETDSPAPLRELHRRLSKRLARKRRPEGEERYVPHLTLARFERPRVFVETLDLDCPAFVVERYLLISSELKRTGAKHREVQTFALDGR